MHAYAHVITQPLSHTGSICALSLRVHTRENTGYKRLLAFRQLLVWPKNDHIFTSLSLEITQDTKIWLKLMALLQSYNIFFKSVISIF